MRILEAIGLLGAGAVLALGASFAWDAAPGILGGGDAAEQTAAANVSVTRAQSNLASFGSISQLEQVVAVSQEPISRQDALTPEQLEVIAFFEDSARAYNEQIRANTGAALRLNNLAVTRLNVRYYYTVGASYGSLDPDAVLAEQRAAMQANLCRQDSLLSLMRDYGFAYTYTYVSQDLRMIGRIEADADACT